MVGIFWKRATAKAGAVTLWSGFAMGMVVFALDLFKAHTGWSMLFMHAAGMLCGICILIMIIVSLLDKNMNTEDNLKLVWDSPLTPLRIKGTRGLMNYKFLSLLVMTAAGVIYFLFRSPSDEKLNAWKAANPEAATRIALHQKGTAPSAENRKESQ
jgi:SSS family solute:Na+ symporter